MYKVRENKSGLTTSLWPWCAYILCACSSAGHGDLGGLYSLVWGTYFSFLLAITFRKFMYILSIILFS